MELQTRPRISSRHIDLVNQNIMNGLVKVDVEENKESFDALNNHIDYFAGTIIKAKIASSNTYPSATFKNLTLSGTEMIRLCAMLVGLKTLMFNTFGYDAIKVRLNYEDEKMIESHNLRYDVALGYKAINGNLDANTVNDLDRLMERYYASLGNLLNERDRYRFKWLKQIYRNSRYTTAKYIMDKIVHDGIIPQDVADNFIDGVRVLKDNSTFFNRNRYCYYLTYVVGIGNKQERNRAVEILTSHDGTTFVENYLANQSTRRI